MSMLCAGCGEGAELGWGGSVDTLSSGAVIVENAARDVPPAWQSEEVVRIGARDGRGPDVFGAITDVELGPDGNVYVLDQQAAEVRVFELRGEHVRTLGGTGRGPGEFQRPYSLAFDARGRLWVADGQRYTVFAADGDVRDTYTTHLRGGLGRGQLRVVDGGP